MVDLAGRMIYNDSGEPIFNFGKHKNKTVTEVLNKEPDIMTGFSIVTLPLIPKVNLPK